MKDLIKHILHEHSRKIEEQRKSKYGDYSINDEPFAKTFFHYIQELPNTDGYTYNRLKKALK